ncbi:2-nitropropane dioxygenase [Ammoniphilus oxalaticus]|uniref:Probable nitronate monooxygenase n=1 Tax=Ammoniphilus oxalaticus TaxID=66863 RepID=A0A419SRP7_9BACL|nr:nitronate monooxygenase [Ammoniphilus oxalaticus]RKD27123.1 2-nitropropane dioxygenase [Ammoniphilus oxalaticus]
MSNNRVCELLEIQYPIIEGGLAYVGNGALAAAVSNGGGFGVVGSAGRTVENFCREIKLAAEQTELPFGVNFPISQHADNDKIVQAILDHKHLIRAVSISAGNPRPYIPIFKDAGLKALVLTSTVHQSLRAEQAGADLVVCEGYEAGGHLGPAEMTLFSLIPQVVRVVSIPVVAAGGLSDGRGILAAFALGAEGVQLGTRFVATTECEAHDAYKRLLLDADDDATTVIERSIGRVTRVLKSQYVDDILAVEQSNPSVDTLLPYIKGRNKIAAIDGKTDAGWLNCGQSVGLIDSIESATSVVKRLVQEVQLLASGDTLDVFK